MLDEKEAAEKAALTIFQLKNIVYALDSDKVLETLFINFTEAVKRDKKYINNYPIDRVEACSAEFSSAVCSSAHEFLEEFRPILAEALTRKSRKTFAGLIGTTALLFVRRCRALADQLEGILAREDMALKREEEIV